jgi:hypothetical protein
MKLRRKIEDVNDYKNKPTSKSEDEENKIICHRETNLPSIHVWHNLILVAIVVAMICFFRSLK